MTEIGPSIPAGMVPLDFALDYAASYLLRDFALELPAGEDRLKAYDAIKEKLYVPDRVLDEILTGIASGQHVLLYGPPGTGKTTLAQLAAKHLFKVTAELAVASSEWTPFETVGGPQLAVVDGKESLQPQAGLITSAVVRCLNAIAASASPVIAATEQAHWLIIDELNRANMDSAFGSYFTALDSSHPEVLLPFFDTPRRLLVVPRRFRIIGTMNSYDKNFLFRMSYALTRRFALVELSVPDHSDSHALSQERKALWRNVANLLNRENMSVEDQAECEAHYGPTVGNLLFDLVSQIRSDNPDGLNRGLGFAQIAAALGHAAAAIAIGLVDDDQAGHRAALDRGVRVAIIPQLEGLASTRVREFLKWWDSDPNLSQLDGARAAAEELLSGIDLFVTGDGN